VYRVSIRKQYYTEILATSFVYSRPSFDSTICLDNFLIWAHNNFGYPFKAYGAPVWSLAHRFKVMRKLHDDLLAA
jgi:hypothetical protein